MNASGSEFVRGWRILVSSLLGISIGVSSIYFYSLGIFIKPISAEFGWGRGDASLGALVGTACAALMAVPVGRLVDRIGSVKVAIGSLLLLALGFALLGGMTSSLISFLVITAMLSLSTAGSSPLPYTRLIVATFHRNRGFALGLSLAGTGLGATLIPTLLTPFISHHGWRLGYFALAGVIVALLPILAWLLPQERDFKNSGFRSVPFLQMIRAPSFRLLSLIFFLASLSIFGSLVHFVPMLTDWGLSPSKAGAIAGLTGVAAIGGRVLLGALLDRVPPLAVVIGIFLAVACGLVALGFDGPKYAVAGALVLGLGIGAEADLIAFLVGRYFAKVLYGQTYGAIYAAFLVGGAIGPAVSGYLQQITGDYRMSLLGSAGVLGMASLLALLLIKTAVPIDS